MHAIRQRTAADIGYHTSIISFYQVGVPCERIYDEMKQFTISGKFILG